MTKSKLTAWERFTLFIAPNWTLRRMQAKSAALAFTRNYEAARPGRRTQGWNRNRGDVNSVTSAAVVELRTHARDLIRNNSWARKAQRVIANNVVGWGIVPKAVGPDEALNTKATALWKRWADSTDCESEGRHTFAGLQRQVIQAIVADGEVLVRRRWRKAKDGLPLPMQLQLLEADFLDTNKDGEQGPAGPIVQGVEYDLIGRRAAYWIFPEHPGSSNSNFNNVSRRIPAEDVLHIFYGERPGQARGVSWFGAAIVNLKDFDEYEDAELMKQKIAACFAAFVTDTDGSGSPLGTEDSDDASIESLEPGMISQLKPGQDVTFGTPPQTTTDNFATRQLRRVAAGLGITYEDLTGDYSQVNFSSARMGRLAHQANVVDWQTNMMIPLFCAGVWRWAMEAAKQVGMPDTVPGAEWTPPALPMLEPDKEGLAYQRLVRVGAMTPSGMVRELGGDPDAHWTEYAADQKKLDALGIKLDSDVRAVSQAGLAQERVGLSKGAAPDASQQSTDSTPADSQQSADDLEVDITEAQFYETIKI